MKKWTLLIFLLFVSFEIMTRQLTSFDWGNPENAIFFSATLIALMVSILDRSEWAWISVLTTAMAVFLLLGLSAHDSSALYYVLAVTQWIALGFVLHGSCSTSMEKMVFSMLLPILLIPFILENSQWLLRSGIEMSIVLSSIALSLIGLFLKLPHQEPKALSWNILALQHTLLRLGSVYICLFIIEPKTRISLGEFLSWPLFALAAAIFLLANFKQASFWDRAVMTIQTIFVIALSLTLSEKDLLVTMSFVVTASIFIITPPLLGDQSNWTAVFRTLETGAIGGVVYILAALGCLRMMAGGAIFLGAAWEAHFTLLGIAIWLRSIQLIPVNRLSLQRGQLWQPRPLLHLLLLMIAVIVTWAMNWGDVHV